MTKKLETEKNELREINWINLHRDASLPVIKLWRIIATNIRILESKLHFKITWPLWQRSFSSLCDGGIPDGVLFNTFITTFFDKRSIFDVKLWWKNFWRMNLGRNNIFDEKTFEETIFDEWIFDEKIFLTKNTNFDKKT